MLLSQTYLIFFFKPTKLLLWWKEKKRTSVSVKIPISPTHTLHFCVNMFSNFFKWRQELRTLELREKWAKTKSWLIGKDPDAGRDWGQEKGMTEDEMAGWHHRLDAHEFGWTPGVGDGQGGLACCDSWGHKESDTTERLNWTEPRQRDRFLLSAF